MLKGKIVDVLSGYGFIKADGLERDFFFHKSAIQNGHFNSVYRGQEVKFSPALDKVKGPKAKEVYINFKGEIE